MTEPVVDAVKKAYCFECGAHGPNSDLECSCTAMVDCIKKFQEFLPKDPTSSIWKERYEFLRDNTHVHAICTTIGGTETWGMSIPFGSIQGRPNPEVAVDAAIQMDRKWKAELRGNLK